MFCNPFALFWRSPLDKLSENSSSPLDNRQFNAIQWRGMKLHVPIYLPVPVKEK
jgi:hypothetical protein